MSKQPADHNNPFTPEFKAYISNVLDEWKVAGISIGVVDGENVYTEGFGFAQLVPNIKATPDTVWYAGSTTKAQLAATIAHLIDNKTYPALSADGWSTPISSILRDDFVVQDEVMTLHGTLEDAACHRTGLFGHEMAIPHLLGNRYATPRDHARTMRNLPLTRSPRTEFIYNNFLYTALSHLVETVTGDWLGDTLKRYVWEPLGMTSTFFALGDALSSGRHVARGYSWNKAQQSFDELPLWSVPGVSGAGVTMSSIVDYVKWIRCLLYETEPFSKAVHADIRRPRVIANPVPSLGMEVTLYALAWWRTIFHGKVLYYHTGSTVSHGAVVYWLPEVEYGVVAFHNYAGPLGHIVARRLVEDKLGIPESGRYDLSEFWHCIFHERDRLVKNAPGVLYPEKPDTPLPSPIKVESLVGTYHNAGYGALAFRQEPHPEHANESILVADRPDVCFGYQLRLHHVSGAFWVAYYYRQNEAKINGPQNAYRAVFMAGVDGEPIGFKFDSTDIGRDVPQGIIVFDKTQ